jgi:hypothetical protein
MTFFNQHRCCARRVENQELLAALPHAFLDCPHRQAVFAEHKAHET